MPRTKKPTKLFLSPTFTILIGALAISILIILIANNNPALLSLPTKVGEDPAGLCPAKIEVNNVAVPNVQGGYPYYVNVGDEQTALAELNEATSELCGFNGMPPRSYVPPRRNGPLTDAEYKKLVIQKTAIQQVNRKFIEESLCQKRGGGSCLFTSQSVECTFNTLDKGMPAETKGGKLALNDKVCKAAGIVKNDKGIIVGRYYNCKDFQCSCTGKCEYHVTAPKPVPPVPMCGVNGMPACDTTTPTPPTLPHMPSVK